MVTVACAPSPLPQPPPPSSTGPPSSPPPTRVRLPYCPRCGAKYKDLERFVTKTSNRNGNSGRPYLKCMPCNKFVTWLDDRGIDDECPTCSCKLLCRRQVAGNKARLIHEHCISYAAWVHVISTKSVAMMMVMNKSLRTNLWIFSLTRVKMI